ncbi:CheR family methyltransferase [Teredinibacter franksiae]|uniref:CheR family methyltransferase n=1 Tax=Teredinibacter franksiae TaxID=2761453 RepID=UPI001C8AB5C4|nr:protein-glutamate O-methyltransferase CheR [Teredinibacter franksiae]
MTFKSAKGFDMREFPMSEGNFKQIKSLAYSLTGISLSDHKQNMIYGRLARRLRKLELKDFDQYCTIISQDHGGEQLEFVNAITTNLTSFFREGHHFDFVERELLPKLLREKASTKRLRIWSAGCSTGEEPYSIAMVLKSCAALSSWDIKILATDLDSNVIAKASDGIYPLERVEGVPAKYKRYISVNTADDLVKMKDAVKKVITFKQLNLLHEWPMKGPFDFIFCRNVVIYFDVSTQVKLFDRFANILIPNGHLFIGHSENLHNITARFGSLGKTIYRLNS